MSGHSKWSTIKRAKGALDAKRGKVFSKLARELIVAAKAGGADPEMNAGLRMVMLKCRSANMPAANIERALQKAAGGGDGPELIEQTYEVYAPHGVAVLAKITTDNKNRTASELRHILTKMNGTLATAGAVSRLFNRKGQIMIAKESGTEDELMELALEAGAEDFQADEGGYEILTDPADFEAVHKKLEENDTVNEAADITFLPELTVPMDNPDEASAVRKLIDALDDHDDVTNVYHNAEFPD